MEKAAIDGERLLAEAVGGRLRDGRLSGSGRPDEDRRVARVAIGEWRKTARELLLFGVPADDRPGRFIEAEGTRVLKHTADDSEATLVM
jgi:hypothetical protein